MGTAHSGTKKLLNAWAIQSRRQNLDATEELEVIFLTKVDHTWWLFYPPSLFSTKLKKCHQETRSCCLMKSFILETLWLAHSPLFILVLNKGGPIKKSPSTLIGKFSAVWEQDAWITTQCQVKDSGNPFFKSIGHRNACFGISRGQICQNLKIFFFAYGPYLGHLTLKPQPSPLLTCMT